LTDSSCFPSTSLAKRAAALAGAIIIGSLASSAMAASEPSTKVVDCGTHSCLQVSGHRSNPASIVSINGHVVPVKGNHGWRVRLPVETVQLWSAPHARTIEVSLHDPETQRDVKDSVDLPIGLLGDVTNLASLEISIR
jgi:hypothetical protein